MTSTTEPEEASLSSLSVFTSSTLSLPSSHPANRKPRFSSSAIPREPLPPFDQRSTILRFLRSIASVLPFHKCVNACSRRYYNAFPDIRITIEDMVAERDKASTAPLPAALTRVSSWVSLQPVKGSLSQQLLFRALVTANFWKTGKVWMEYMYGSS